MKTAILAKYLDSPEFSKYLAIHPTNIEKAFQLYQSNIDLAISIIPLLSLYELSLRNNLHAVLSDHFGSKDWLLNEKKGFMNDRSLKDIGYHLRDAVILTEKQLIDNCGLVTIQALIAEQSLGFWVRFFEKNYCQLLLKAPLKAFPLKPITVSRNEIHRQILTVKNLRNKIYHNKSILLHHSQIDITTTSSTLQTIIDHLSWIDPELASYGKTIVDLKEISNNLKKL